MKKKKEIGPFLGTFQCAAPIGQIVFLHFKTGSASTNGMKVGDFAHPKNIKSLGKVDKIECKDF